MEVKYPLNGSHNRKWIALEANVSRDYFQFISQPLSNQFGCAFLLLLRKSFHVHAPFLESYVTRSDDKRSELFANETKKFFYSAWKMENNDCANVDVRLEGRLTRIPFPTYDDKNASYIAAGGVRELISEFSASWRWHLRKSFNPRLAFHLASIGGGRKWVKDFPGKRMRGKLSFVNHRNNDATEAFVRRESRVEWKAGQTQTESDAEAYRLFSYHTQV